MSFIFNFLRKVFFQLVEIFLQIIVHKRCFYCNHPTLNRHVFCHSCLNAHPFSVPFFDKKQRFFVYFLGQYNGFLRFVVNQKYCRNPLVYYGIQERIYEFFKLYKLSDLFDVIVPMPKSTLSRMKHTFNPAQLIAEMIAAKFQKDIFLDVYTKQLKKRQVGQKYSQRKENNKNIFFLSDSRKSFLKGKKILIIDDVYTTGATIAGLIEALHDTAYASVVVFVLAK